MRNKEKQTFHLIVGLMAAYLNGNYADSQAFIINETRSLLFKLLKIVKLYLSQTLFSFDSITIFHFIIYSKPLLLRERVTE